MPIKLHEIDYYAPYAVFSDKVRTWLVAYGIGAPVLLASQSTLASKFAAHASHNTILCIYFAGIGLQIAASLIYKSVSWYLLRYELEKAGRLGYKPRNPGETFDESVRFKVSRWIYRQHWLELMIDLATICCYIVATFKVLEIVKS